MFASGQVWTYRTRPGEEASRLFVTRIDDDARLGTIVHVRVCGLRISNPAAAGGLSDEISHMPFAEAAVAASVVTHVASEPSSELDTGYKQWRDAFDRGQAGVFTVSVAEAVGLMETALSQ